MSEFKKNKRIIFVIAIAFLGIIISGAFFVPAQTTLTKIPENELDKQKIQPKLGSSNEIVEFNGEVKDSISFTNALKSRGLSVKNTEEIPDSFFSVPIKVFSISGIDVQVYEFTSEYEIAKAKAIISKDGTQIGLNSVRWMDTPHFYSNGKIIVQYIGNNPEITNVLESFLGKQFAGSE